MLNHPPLEDFTTKMGSLISILKIKWLHEDTLQKLSTLWVLHKVVEDLVTYMNNNNVGMNITVSGQYA